jgi:hypothetical protein
MFVVAPLQASGIVVFQAVGVFAALAMMTGVLILSGSAIAAFALLVAISMNVFVIILRLRGTPSAFDLHMVAAAWLVLSITLGAVVGRAVFAPFASSAIYFSFVTLTTVGYGDIVRVHPIARSLCNLEAICGQLYPATLLARIVTLEVASRH